MGFSRSRRPASPLIYRAHGKRLGRPTVGEDVEKTIRAALSKGDKGIRKIARELGMGVSVVQRLTKYPLLSRHKQCLFAA